MLCLRRSRTTHQDRHVVCKTHCFLDLSQTVSRRRCQDTHVKTYVVASFPAAPLLTDTRRSTVGPGTLEDFVVTVYNVVMEYIAPALASFMLWYNRSTCSSGGYSPVFSGRSTCANGSPWPAPVVIASRALVAFITPVPAVCSTCTVVEYFVPASAVIAAVAPVMEDISSCKRVHCASVSRDRGAKTSCQVHPASAIRIMCCNGSVWIRRAFRVVRTTHRESLQMTARIEPNLAKHSTSLSV